MSDLEVHRVTHSPLGCTHFCGTDCDVPPLALLPAVAGRPLPLPLLAAAPAWISAESAPLMLDRALPSAPSPAARGPGTAPVPPPGPCPAPVEPAETPSGQCRPPGHSLEELAAGTAVAEGGGTARSGRPVASLCVTKKVSFCERGRRQP